MYASGFKYSSSNVVFSSYKKKTLQATSFKSTQQSSRKLFLNKQVTREGPYWLPVPPRIINAKRVILAILRELILHETSIPSSELQERNLFTYHVHFGSFPLYCNAKLRQRHIFVQTPSAFIEIFGEVFHLTMYCFEYFLERYFGFA